MQCLIPNCCYSRMEKSIIASRRVNTHKMHTRTVYYGTYVPRSFGQTALNILFVFFFHFVESNEILGRTQHTYIRGPIGSVYRVAFCIVCLCVRVCAAELWNVYVCTCDSDEVGLRSTANWTGSDDNVKGAPSCIRRSSGAFSASGGHTASSGGRRNQVHCVEYYNYQFDQWTWGTLFLFHYILLFSFALLGVCVSVCVFGHGQCSTVDHGRRDRWVCVRMTRSHFILALHIFY